jgi:hypothetical protein
MKRNLFFLVFLSLIASVASFAQDFPRSAILDPTIYDSLPQKAVQVSRAYETLPLSVSLKPYAPLPGNQNPYGTCTAWASAYSARTILESISLGRRDGQSTTVNAFSPNFVYKLMFAYNNQPDDPEGLRGAAISWALNFLRGEGAVKMSEREKALGYKNIPLSMFNSSAKYPIAEYAALFGSSVSNPAVKVQMVKKSIAESKPVVIGMNCPPSFNRAQDVWRPSETSGASYGGHAMCVIGYDDTKYGGAFEVLNSWGESWGNKGFIWIPYSAFSDFVFEAYGITDNPALYQEKINFAGFAQIEVLGGNGMSVGFQNGYYRTLTAYKSGTRFRYLLGNKDAAFVYAFAADDTNAAPTAIFPLAGVSPMLDYSENTVAFPGEFNWIQLDNRIGTDYLVVLYAKHELDIAAIRGRFAASQGSFPERVAWAVGADYLPASQVTYAPSKLEFAASSANKNAVLGLLLAIRHE